VSERDKTSLRRSLGVCIRRRDVQSDRRSTGSLKMHDQKMQDLKMRNQMYGVKNAGPENAGTKNAGTPMNAANLFLHASEQQCATCKNTAE